MPQYILLGPVKIYFYGIFISLAIVFWYLYLKSSLKRKKEHFYIDSILSVSLISALLGARIYHVLSQWPYYEFRSIKILFIWEGGLGIFGALAGGLTGLYILSKIKKIDLIPLLNVISPPLLIVQAIGRVGNFFNHEAYSQTNFPLFLLESILCFSSFFLYFFLIRKRTADKFGFSFYLISYGLIRFLTEFFRTDTLVIYNIRAGHIFSLVMIISGLLLLNQSFKPPRRRLGGTTIT